MNNSMQGELTAIVSQLITFTKRQHYTLVYPGTIQEGGQLTTTLALVVTPGGVVGLNCFGFAGEIRPGDQPNDQWRQHINHTDNRIPNPVTTSEKQQVLLRRAMDRAGLSGIPVEVIAVFTSKEARLTGVSAQKCFDRDGMIAYLEQERFHSGPVEDTHETGVKLKSLVTVYKSEKKQEEKRNDLRLKCYLQSSGIAERCGCILWDFLNRQPGTVLLYRAVCFCFFLVFMLHFSIFSG